VELAGNEYFFYTSREVSNMGIIRFYLFFGTPVILKSKIIMKKSVQPIKHSLYIVKFLLYQAHAWSMKAVHKNTS
jgi:hypothetical protein